MTSDRICTNSTRSRGTAASIFAAHLVDHFGRRAVALALRLESHDDVAAILLRREQAELGAGAPRRPGDLRRRRENLLDDVHLPVGLGQRRAARAEVVEDERAFVDLRQEARRRDALGENAGDDEHRPRPE